MEQTDSDPGEAKKAESEAEQSQNYSTKREPDQPETNIYYREFSKLYLANLILNTHLKELNQEKQDLLGRLSKVEVPAELR